MIDCFENEYEFLSNFAASPITDDEGIEFPTVEHFFQASKAKFKHQYRAIAAAPTPGKAKWLGRRVELRSDWEQVKDEIMLEGVRKKFAIPELREKLLATGDEELMEGTWWHDNEWGNCSCEKCQNIIGKNKLGKILMKVREEIKSSM